MKHTLAARHATLSIAASVLCAALVRANHGPGTSGGGSSVASAETLKAGQIELSLRSDVTQFEKIGRTEAGARALRSGGFDGLNHSVVETFSLAYGVTDDLQVGAQTGYYWGSSFLAADPDGMGGVDSAGADPNGMTDLWLSGKYRLMHGPSGHLAAFGAIKLPTGQDGERLSNGEKLEPSSQPSSGAFDYQLGLAYSRYLTTRMTMDASAAYTLRTEHNGFQVGDRADAGVSLGYRLTEDVKSFPNWSVSGEILGVWLGKDDDHGDVDANSGGTTLYVSPGARVRFDPHVALSLAPLLPVHQDLGGDQIETRFKIAATLSLSF